MSYIEELIKKYCPNGVEWKKLGEICNYIRGVTYNKLEEVNDNSKEYWKVLRANNITFEYNTLNFNEIKKISKDVKINKNQFLYIDDILICAGSGSKEHIGKVAYIDKNLDFTFGGFMGVLRVDRNKLISRYLFHILTSNIFRNHLQYNLKSTTINNLNSNIVNTLKIPLPTLEIQKEIVRILDSFTNYSNLLNKELELRLKQYEYYRDELLNFENNSNVEWKTLGEIATEIYRGNGITKDEVTSDGIPCVRYGEIYTKYNIWFNKCFSYTKEEIIKNRKYFENGDLLFAITGESTKDILKSCVYIGNEKCLAGGDIVVMKHNQNPKYMSYVLSTSNAQTQKSKGKVKSKVVHANVQDIKNILVPIPPLEEQERIVNILDRFDTLCNSITKGLPREIELRKKQYEHYREKLLNFDIAK